MYSPNFRYSMPQTHINRGPFAGPPNDWLVINMTWPGVSNIGDAAGFVSLRFSLEEHRGLGFPNIDWVIYSPLTNEGGPRFVKDKIFEDTNGAHFVNGGVARTMVGPGQTVSLPASILIPGIVHGQAMVDFWNNEGNVEFNLHMWLFEVNAQDSLIPHGEDRQSIVHHAFDPGFQLV